MLTFNFWRFKQLCIVNTVTPSLSRLGHILRGNPPGVARTLDQILRKDYPLETEEVLMNVNIGFPSIKNVRSSHLCRRELQKGNVHFEKEARSNILQIDLKRLKINTQKLWAEHNLTMAAKHYGIFRDLFDSAYFVPRVPLYVQFNANGNLSHPVKSGNVIDQRNTYTAPIVAFDASIELINLKETPTDSYWTLVLTNPDGHFSGEEKEYVHWFISNIPNGDVQKGEVIVPYLRPFPAKGLGYQRFIFILYKQTKKLNFETYKLHHVNGLKKRTFSTQEFYGIFQNDITPAGLSFFQCIWNNKVTDFYHNELNMGEPIYEYEFPKVFFRDQAWFPLKQRFNIYMDKHRHQKQVNKEYFKLKLDTIHPFKGEQTPLQFPNAHPLRNISSWQKTEARKNRLKIGRINQV